MQIPSASSSRMQQNRDSDDNTSNSSSRLVTSCLLQPLSGWNGNMNDNNETTSNNRNVVARDEARNSNSNSNDGCCNGDRTDSSSRGLMSDSYMKHQSVDNQGGEDFAAGCCWVNNGNSFVSAFESFGQSSSFDSDKGASSSNDTPDQQQRHQGKAKFKNVQPTLVLKRDYEIVHKALTMQQQQTSDMNNSSNQQQQLPAIIIHSNNQHPSSEYSDSLTATSDLGQASSDLGHKSTISSQPPSDTASVTSDFIAWLDTPMASAPGSIPPLLTFSKDEKGQPVTVVFYHDHQQQQPSDDQQQICSDVIKDAKSVEDQQIQLLAALNRQELVPKSSASSATSSIIDRSASGSPYLPTPWDSPPVPTPWDSPPVPASCDSLPVPPSCDSPPVPISSDSTPVPTSTVTLKFSAGVCLLRKRVEDSNVIPEVLVIRRSSEQFYELPKGHLEKGESLMQAACRELVEETGIKTPIEILSPVFSERYVVKQSATERLEKSVHYFRARLLSQAENAEVTFGEREEETKELKWMRLEEAKKARWKSTAVKSVVIMALTASEH